MNDVFAEYDRARAKQLKRDADYERLHKRLDCAAFILAMGLLVEYGAFVAYVFVSMGRNAK